MKNFSILTLSLLFICSFFACDHDEHSEDHYASLNLAYKVGDANFSYNNIYTIGGTAVSFSFAQFYMSNISIAQENGTKSTFENLYILAKPERDTCALGSFTIDHIHTLHFDLGIDSLTNHQTTQDFTSQPANSPLALQTPEAMHWSWNTGYIFMKINAMVDTNNDGTPDQATEYHIGTDALLTPVSLTINEDVDSDHGSHNQTIALNFDIAALFNNINLSTGEQTHTGDNLPLAQQIASNYALAFSKQ